MDPKLKVFKFGGASVKDAAGVRNMAEILQKYKNDHLLIVVSAMGKTTNALEKVVDAYFYKKGNAFELFNQVKNQHFAIAAELFPEGHDIFPTLNDSFIEIEWVIEDDVQDDYDYLYDQIVSIGEMVSTKIISAYLCENGLPAFWLDVRDAIVTDNTYREGKVQWPETQKRCKR